MEEEDGTDRLWLVVRSLKSPTGKYVSILYNNDEVAVFEKLLSQGYL